MLTNKERRRRRAENFAAAGFAIEGIEFGLKNVGSEIENATTKKFESGKVRERERRTVLNGTVDLEKCEDRNDELGFIVGEALDSSKSDGLNCEEI